MKIWSTISNPKPPKKDKVMKEYKKEVAPRDKTEVSKPRIE